MNTPVRRLSFLVAALFAALLVSTTLIQYVFAADLNGRADNRRTLLATYARERGEILVGQDPVAKSVPTDDEFKFQRTYDDPELYAHVSGFYSFFGAVGGLEQSENSLLSGASDKLFYRRVSDLFTGRRPSGATIETTLDAAVQKAASDPYNAVSTLMAAAAVMAAAWRKAANWVPSSTRVRVTVSDSRTTPPPTGTREKHQVNQPLQGNPATSPACEQ